MEHVSRGVTALLLDEWNRRFHVIRSRLHNGQMTPGYLGFPGIRYGPHAPRGHCHSSGAIRPSVPCYFNLDQLTRGSMLWAHEPRVTALPSGYLGFPATRCGPHAPRGHCHSFGPSDLRFPAPPSGPDILTRRLSATPYGTDEPRGRCTPSGPPEPMVPCH